jgi:hypothetical protein
MMHSEKTNDTTTNTTILRVDEHYKKLKNTKEFRHFYSHESNHLEIANAIVNIIKTKKIKVISYDVFDTVLLRECKSEARRFWDISQKFSHAVSEKYKSKKSKNTPFKTEDAFLARIAAARASYSISETKNHNREGTLESIARITCDLLGCIELTPLYISTEINYETSTLSANLLLKTITDLTPNVQPVFISDMYLESDKIKKLLIGKFGLPANTIVYSSADGYGSKRSGQLFPHVVKELNQNAGQILHIGDSLISDYQMPRANGLNAFYLPMPEYEKQGRRDCYNVMCNNLAKQNINLSKLLKFNF